MTRRTLFRNLLAFGLIDNFTAYWFVLPRRAKVTRNRQQWLRQEHQRLISRLVAQRFVNDHKRYLEVRAHIATSGPAAISEREFRLPFSISA